MTENEKIELFDKWYDENYDEWAEGEEGIALREELEQAFKGGIEALEKENAELKEKYAKNITDCDICDTYCNSQLTKAKEIIKTFCGFCSVFNSTNGSFDNLIAEAEQFLSEVEK